MATRRTAKKAVAKPPRPTETWSTTHSIRFDDKDWEKLTKKAKVHGGNSRVIRRLVSLYLTNPMIADHVANQPDPVSDRARFVADPSTDRRLSVNHPEGKVPRAPRTR